MVRPPPGRVNRGPAPGNHPSGDDAKADTEL